MRSLRCLLLLLLVVVVGRRARALSVDVTPVARRHATPSSSSWSSHEALTQRWTVTATSPHEQLRALQIDALCQVVVSYAPPDEEEPALLATVLVSGSDFRLITAADVVSPAPETLALRLLETAQLATIDGFVGVQILVHAPQMLRRLHVTGTDDVVVRDKVVVEHDPYGDVVVAVDGSGVVHLPARLTLTASSIAFATNGSASLFLPTASSLNATSVSFLQAGSGTINATSAALQATRTIAVAASGSGSVCIDASLVEMNAIQVHATSDGDVYVGGHDGSYEATHHYFCEVAQVLQSGAGSVDLGTILCIDIAVDLYGSGNVTVSSARSIGGHAFGSGKILFAGEYPEDVLPVDPWAFIKQPIATPAYGYQSHSCVVPTAPPRTQTRIEGNASIVHHIVTPARLGVVALLGLCIGAVYFTETRRQRLVRRQHRAERTPLLGER